jgi:hypothetical protein
MTTIILTIMAILVALAFMSADQKKSLVKSVVMVGGLIVLGFVLFYGWGLYLYKQDRLNAMAPQTVGTPVALPECSDPYEPYTKAVKTCEWHEEKHSSKKAGI